MTWSQWAPDQSIYIAELTTPTTLSSNRVKLSSPTAPWEQKGWNVSEGPAFIKRNNKLHIVFSVSGCSTSDYALARLTCSNGDYLNPSAWVKTTGPVFARSEANRVWGVGHHAFTKSPDGTEDWLVYHAKASQVNTNADRSSRIQIFTWDANDNPVFGEPYPVTMKLPRPSDGTGTKQTITFDALPNKTINDASFTIAATASSGLPVTLRVQSGPAIITNGVVQLSGTPGTVRIYATQEGDGTYCAAWPVFREFKVTSSDVKPGDGDGLTGSYYNGLNWDTKVLDRVDPNVNFDWGLNNPALGVNADNFSVKWKGYIMPLYTDIYNFSLISDNGRSLKVNNFTIIDHFESDWGKEYVGSVSLTAGKRVPIEINYKEENGGANIKLYWWSNNQTKQLVPKSQLFTTLTSSNVSEVPAPKLDVFPNPARNTVTVLSPNALDQVSILNSLGNIIQKYQISGCSECTCDVEQLPDGVYYILAKGDNSVNTQKLIIRR
jgi:hypothetical protein